MRKIKFFFIALFLGCNGKTSTNIEDNTPKVKFKDKDYENAVFLAEKEWVRIYGIEVYDSRPFIAKKKNDSIWVVEGSLPEDYDGGVPYVEVNVKIKKVINVSHGK